ncbi:unnamed protein product [Adineta steineri]|uniref:CTCK domain-containing protein n=2 Tax=Adineta steineri TaxID=433720 RepID=A0A815EYW4_9BILA|nr:unnamed protein product [Adineta steineri]
MNILCTHIPGTTGVSAGTTPAHASETSQATGTGITSVSGSATGVTSASGSTTVGASGTTTKQCQEMEAVDDAVSKTITVTPKDIDQNKKGDFKPDSKTGVNFPEEDKHPTINVPFGTPATVRGVSMPRDTTNSNVESFKVTFYGTNNEPINKQPLESTPSGGKNQPASLNPSQIPSDVLVKRVEITDIKTTDNQAPRGVVLDIKACTEATAGTTGVSAGTTPVHGSETSQGTGTGITSVTGSTTTGKTPTRCSTENSLDEALGLIGAESITETTKAETKPVGFSIRVNGSGWTPSSAFSSLNIDFRHPVEIGRIRLTADNLKDWRLYYQSASDVFPRLSAYNNPSVIVNNEIILSTTLNATKIRITPNSDVKNLHVEVFACSSFVAETTTTGTPCVLSEWSAWSPCSRTCGIGFKTRTRNGSSSKSCSEAQLIEHQSCSDRRCECLLDEAFYVRIFNKKPVGDKEIGYVDTYSNGTTQARNIIYVNDTVDQGTMIRTRDSCHIVHCTADGLKLSDNQCLTTTTTTPITNTTRCTVQQFDSSPLKVNNGQCTSRDSFPRERCSGQCESDSMRQCTCCSVGETYVQSVVFDCFANGSPTVTEQKTIQIRRIKSCNCNVCSGGIISKN